MVHARTRYLFEVEGFVDGETRTVYRPWEACFCEGELGLPALAYASDEESSRDTKRPSCELVWPGQMGMAEPPGERGFEEDDCADDLPLAFAEGLFETRPELQKLLASCVTRDGRVPLRNALELGLPDDVPNMLAYHLAVNVARYGDKHLRPVNGLPVKFVQRVVTARFTPDHHHWSTIAYVKQLAEVNWGSPLLTGFDTAVSDALAQIAVQGARAYFMMLREALDAKGHEDLDAWVNWNCLAGYLFWTGRTGGGLVEDHAEMHELIAFVARDPERASVDEREIVGALRRHHEKLREKRAAELCEHGARHDADCEACEDFLDELPIVDPDLPQEMKDEIEREKIKKRETRLAARAAKKKA